MSRLTRGFLFLPPAPREYNGSASTVVNHPHCGQSPQSLLNLAIPVFASDAASGQAFPANHWKQANPGPFRWHFCLSQNPNRVCLVSWLIN